MLYGKDKKTNQDNQEKEISTEKVQREKKRNNLEKMCIIAGLSPPWSGLDPLPLRVGFTVEDVA